VVSAWSRTAEGSCAILQPDDDRGVGQGGRREAKRRRAGARDSCSMRRYAALIQAIGWDSVAEHMPPEAVTGLRSAFDEAGINPVEVEFPDGARVYLEEVVRSSLHPGSAEAAQQLLEGTQRVKGASQSVWDHLRVLR
jgi:hypothetical protein